MHTNSIEGSWGSVKRLVFRMPGSRNAAYIRFDLAKYMFVKKCMLQNKYFLLCFIVFNFFLFSGIYFSSFLLFAAIRTKATLFWTIIGMQMTMEMNSTMMTTIVMPNQVL